MVAICVGLNVLTMYKLTTWSMQWVHQSFYVALYYHLPWLVPVTFIVVSMVARAIKIKLANGGFWKLFVKRFYNGSGDNLRRNYSRIFDRRISGVGFPTPVRSNNEFILW